MLQVGEVGELAELFQWRPDSACRMGLPGFSEAERQSAGEEMSDVGTGHCSSSCDGLSSLPLGHLCPSAATADQPHWFRQPCTALLHGRGSRKAVAIHTCLTAARGFLTTGLMKTAMTEL